MKINLPIALLFSFVFIGNILVAQTKAEVDAHKRKWNMPDSVVNIKNPLIHEAGAADAGKATYMKICSVCHGAKGKGDGLAALGLAVKPADHTTAIVQSQTDGALFYELSEGHAPMPAYKAILTEKERWELVSYIRTLKPQPKVKSKS